MEVLIVMLGVLEEARLVSGLVEPGGGPGELVSVVGALVVLGRAAYGLVVKAPVTNGKVVQLTRVTQQLLGVRRVAHAKQERGSRERRRRLACQVRTCGRNRVKLVFFSYCSPI